jgi:hypothetical protein
METASMVEATVAESMPVEMMPAVITAPDEDVVIRTPIAIIIAVIRPGVPVVIIGAAVGVVITRQVRCTAREKEEGRTSSGNQQEAGRMLGKASI